MAACDHFIDISDMDDQAAAARIHADGVDILIDLKGFTSGARSGIVLLRPAPIIVNYLGYPGTMGAGMCDYLITDRFLTPAASAPDYAEALAYMPHTYHPHGRRTPPGTRPGRREVGLPEEGFVFCCFNQPYKISPDIFAIWCRLLALVPDSVLWLLDHPHAAGNLRSEAIRHGVDARRLVFGANLPQAAHLARLQLADLMLDTAPFNAHTTASDALWAGVPIVTCPGETFPSRVAGSILHAVGLGELVAEDHAGYFELAYDIATEPGRLAAPQGAAGRQPAGDASVRRVSLHPRPRRPLPGDDRPPPRPAATRNNRCVRALTAANSMRLPRSDASGGAGCRRQLPRYAARTCGSSIRSAPLPDMTMRPASSR